MTEQEQKAFTAMREALESVGKAIPLGQSTVKTCYAINNTHRDAVHAALTAANAVSHPQATEPANRLTKLKLLMVTTAYEQGVGKGIQRRSHNPYAPNTDEYEAWDIGYREGLDKPAAPEAHHGK